MKPFSKRWTCRVCLFENSFWFLQMRHGQNMKPFDDLWASAASRKVLRPLIQAHCAPLAVHPLSIHLQIIYSCWISNFIRWKRTWQFCNNKYFYYIQHNLFNNTYIDCIRKLTQTSQKQTCNLKIRTTTHRFSTVLAWGRRMLWRISCWRRRRWRSWNLRVCILTTHFFYF